MSSLLILTSATLGIVMTASSASAGSGTVVLDGKDLSDPNDRGNESKLDCDIPVQFKGFADKVDQTATLLFEGQGADAGKALTVHGENPVQFTGVGTGVAALRTYYVTGADHLKVTFTVQPDGFSDSKVFKLEPCTLSGTVAKSVDADLDGTYDASTETAPAPGAEVRFKTVVTNTSPLPVSLTGLTDAYPASGVLPADPGSAPTCFTTAAMDVAAAALPQTLQPNGTYTCYFKILAYSGAFGASRVNTVTATMTSPGSTTITPADTATTRTAAAPGAPTLTATVTKTADADGNGTDDFTSPSQAATAGQAVKFKVVVQNTTAGHSVELDSLSDAYPAAGGGTTTVTPSCFTTSAMNVAAATLPQTLAAGGTYTCYFQVSGYSPPAGGSLTNTVTAEVSKAGSTTIFPTGQATTTTAAAPTLTGTVTKTVDADGNGTDDFAATSQAPSSGQAVKFKAVVQNTTAGHAVQLDSLSDAYPAGGGTTTVTPTCFTTSAMDVAAPALPQTLAPNAMYTCYFQLAGYSPSAGGSIENTVTAAMSRAGSASIAPAGKATTTTAAAVIQPGGAVLVPDLAVKKSGPATAAPGDAITWTLTVTSKGTGAASGFTVTDTVPSGVALTSLSGAGFSCTLSTAVCTHAGSLAPGSTAVVTAVGTLSSGFTGTSVANTAIVGPTDGSADNSDTVVTVVRQPQAQPGPADLAIEKAAQDELTAPGEEVSWALTVTNVGDSDAALFSVTDELGDGLTLVSIAGEGFDCEGATCTYGGSLAPGDSVSLTVTTALDQDWAQSTVVNAASVVLEGDPTLGNNNDTALAGVVLPIDGGSVDPGSGPEPDPEPSMPSQLPFTDEDEEPQPAALPFTGAATDVLLALGAGLSVLGLLLALTGRRRRTTP